MLLTSITDILESKRQETFHDVGSPTDYVKVIKTKKNIDFKIFKTAPQYEKKMYLKSETRQVAKRKFMNFLTTASAVSEYFFSSQFKRGNGDV